MPLVAFKPTKARLVIEQGKDSVLVMRILAASDETLSLASGERLSAMSGVLRVREQKPYLDRADRKLSGSLVYVPGSERGQASAKFQINIAMAAKKFDALLRVALAGRLPTKLFIEAGGHAGPFRGRGIRYEANRNGRVKLWDNREHPILSVSSFTVILPIDVPESAEDESTPPPPAGEGLATSAQVAELADELLAFQAETNYTLKAIVAIIAVILLLAVVFNVVLLYR